MKSAFNTNAGDWVWDPNGIYNIKSGYAMIRSEAQKL